MSRRQTSSSRRSFMRRAAAFSTAPFLLPSKVWANPPSSRITLGFIGLGIQSRGLLNGFLGQKDVQVLALSDVYQPRAEKAKETVVNRYGENKPEGWKGCDIYRDFRELIARSDIDAVVIATPDHWHAIQTVAALNAGKDVYCEKPLTHNVQEAIAVMDAVKRNKRVLQTGSMQRSMGEFRVAAELVRNGIIGKISKVETSFGGAPRPNDLAEEPLEEGLDWNMWLGPAPEVHYSSVLAPRGIHGHFPLWREYTEYGGGYVTDWGAHHIDIAHWGIGADDNGPVRVTPSESSVQAIEAKENLKIRGGVLTYANGVEVIHKDGYGVHFYGSDGEVKVNRGKFEVILKGEVFAKKSSNDDKVSVESQYIKAEKELLADAKVKLQLSRNHLADFLNSIRERTNPVADEEVGGRTAIACNLLNVAYRTGKTIQWDPLKNVVLENSVEAKQLTREYRGDWKV